MSSKALAVISPVKALAPRGAAAPVAQTAAQRVINEFQSDTVEIDTAPEPLTARATLWVLAAAVVCAITWASFASIDRIVTGQGRLVPVAPNILVQAFDAAIIRSINVRPGDVVRAGQVLATLDPTFAQADLEQTKAKVAALDAVTARLEAEQHGRQFVPAPEDRYGYQQLQAAIWNERSTQLVAQMRLFEERLARAATGRLAREQEREYLKSRLSILREVEGMRNELEQAKTGSRLNSLIARDTRIEVERSLTRAETGIIESQHEIEAIEAERDVFRRQWESRLVEELVTKRGERDGYMEVLVKALKRQEMVNLETPVDAVVLEVGQRSVGSIIQSAEAMFKLVPLDSPLEIEAKIDAKEIARIAVGDEVQVKFDSFSYQEHGMGSGVVKVVSSDAFTDTKDPQAGAYYRVRIDLNDVQLRNVPDEFRLKPGLPVTAEIKIGKRTVMEYLMRPVLRGMNESMRGP
jgi:hemolysin D